LRGTTTWTAVGAIGSAALLAFGAGAGAERATGAQLTNVTVQLKWVTQAQFAGYYAAKERGYYRQQGLNVTITPGSPDLAPKTVVAGGQAQFGVNWFSNLLAARDEAANLVNIAQVFTRSGFTLLTWRDTGLNRISQLRGKTVANWLDGNEWEVYAALRKNGIDPYDTRQVAIFEQPFSMDFFIRRQTDAASAMTYNELAQVLEARNPRTGKLFRLRDLNVFKMENVGTGMLEDGIFVRADWIAKATNRAIARRFLIATLKGWIYCRDHYLNCTNISVRNGTELGRGHQRWQMNEINALIWPAPKGIGVMDQKAYARTVAIAKRFQVVTNTPKGAYRTDIARAAVAALRRQGLDVFGKRWKKAKIQVTPGGK